MKEFIASLHPILTAFPGVLIILACFFEFFCPKRFKTLQNDLVLFLLGVLTVMAVLTFLSGLAAADFASKTFSVPDEPLATHYTWARAATFLTPVIFGLKYVATKSHYKSGLFRGIFRVVLLAFLTVFVITGNLGGTLVFVHGAGVSATLKRLE